MARKRKKHWPVDCRAWVTITAIAVTSLTVHAQTPELHFDEQSDVLDQIVVVANKSQRSVREIAANVTVLSRESLDLELANSLADALRYTPGIDYEGAGTRFGHSGVSIRGIGGNRVALLVDGVALSDQFSIGSFANATRDFANAGFIQKIEVLHGPASALYGSSAIGGVVAMRTPDPADLTQGSGRGGVLSSNWSGADASLNGAALYAVEAESLGMLLGVGARNGEEFDAAAASDSLDQRDYQRRSALMKVVKDDTSGNTWKLAYYHQSSDVESSLSSMLGGGRFRSTTALEGDDRYQMDMLSAEYDFGSGDGWIDEGLIRTYYQWADVQQLTLDERGAAARPVSIDRTFAFEQTLGGAELNLQKTIVGDAVTHRLGFGAEFRRRETEEYRNGLETGIEDGLQSSVLLGEAFPLRDFPISTSTDLGAYFEDAMSWSDWTLIAALRVDRYDLDARADDMYREDYPFADLVSLSESELSPKLGAIYRATDSIDIFLQYSEGFRAPPYEDANIGLEIPAFNIRAIPNPDLKSERSAGIDVGLRWVGGNNSGYLSVFRTDYDDFIETKVRLGPDPLSGRILFQSQNINAAVIEGVEAGWSVSAERLLTGLTFDGSLYWAQGENRDTDQALNSVGPAQAVVGLGWASQDGTWNSRLRGTFTAEWSERDETAGELFKPPGYSVFDVFLSKRFGDRFTTRFAVLNLGDREYWSWSDVRGLAPDDPVIPYLSRPGISVTVGLDIRW